MHACYLGIFGNWSAHLFRALVASNVFDAPAHYSPTGRLFHVLDRFKARLNEWYRERHRRDPLNEITKIQDINDKMLGTTESPAMNLKANEMKWLQFFRPVLSSQS